MRKLRLKNIEQTRNYFIKETEQTELMSKKHDSLTLSTTLTYIKHVLI